MKDLIHAGLKVVDHERWKIIGLVIGVIIVVSMVGCDVKIRSPFSLEKITREEFKMEIMTADNKLEAERLQLEQAQLAYNSKVELRNEKVKAGESKFEEAEKLQTGFIEIAGGVATTLATGGQLNTASILMSVLALGGVGTAIGGVVDSARKNKVIKDQKNNNEKPS